MAPELIGLAVGDPPAGWEALGFAVVDGSVALAGVTVALGAATPGIAGWSVGGVDAAVDGLPVASVTPGTPVEHPNGATGIDHVVVLTPDFDRTAAALDAAGMPLRRVVDGPRGRMGFRRLGSAILEVVLRADGPAGPARFWGLVVTVSDLEALAGRLGDRLGPVRPAVQPGRHIATLRPAAGLSAAVAFMDAG